MPSAIWTLILNRRHISDVEQGAAIATWVTPLLR